MGQLSTKEFPKSLYLYLFKSFNIFNNSNSSKAKFYSPSDDFYAEINKIVP